MANKTLQRIACGIALTLGAATGAALMNVVDRETAKTTNQDTRDFNETSTKVVYKGNGFYSYKIEGHTYFIKDGTVLSRYLSFSGNVGEERALKEYNKAMEDPSYHPKCANTDEWHVVERIVPPELKMQRQVKQIVNDFNDRVNAGFKEVERKRDREELNSYLPPSLRK
jgi:hypothetical protein